MTNKEIKANILKVKIQKLGKIVKTMDICKMETRSYMENGKMEMFVKYK